MGVMSINPDSGFWHGRSVFVTGHTGFKGGWVSIWLSMLGAKVYGYSLAPPSQPNFFEVTKLQNVIKQSLIGDVRDYDKLYHAMHSAKPSVIIHMAAQSLVRKSYENPLDTFSTNVMGTVNLMEAARRTDTVQAVLNITTDKCYENKEWTWSYRENDQLGGHDPYSSSKACSELVTVAYRNSFFSRAGIQIASARAGNVIGGGDWAKDRLVPDFLRSVDAGEMLRIRSPKAIRPWQHVLDPLCGYLLLAEKLVREGEEFSQAWNFGPDETDAKTTSWVVERLSEKFSSSSWILESGSQPYEATLLKLDSSKAKARLKWRPRWSLETALDQIVTWHQSFINKNLMTDVSIKQIEDYERS